MKHLLRYSVLLAILSLPQLALADAVGAGGRTAAQISQAIVAGDVFPSVDQCIRDVAQDSRDEMPIADSLPEQTDTDIISPPVQVISPAAGQEPSIGEAGDEGENYVEQGPQEQAATIWDPLEPFNRAMYQFNDKLYFWLLKPVAKGYAAVIPEKGRISARNFFSNLAFPIRFVSCLLQANFSGAATELERFTINTIWGVGGLLDPASGGELNLARQNADLGQTLGIY
ncbi:MAG: VacJ family lipoprotein, partial [Smithellaceae bacterium]|nr:VacJ family lipoprotein [Smithellaceae bacterium]